MPDQVINPSKVINGQFSAIAVATEAGLVHTRVVFDLGGDSTTLNADLTDPDKRVSIDRKEIDGPVVWKTSLMTVGLFNRMTREEILDLAAYLTSAGDSRHEFFRD